MAGGFTYRADKKDIRVIRAADPKQKKVKVGENDVVLPGDIISIGERFF